MKEAGPKSPDKVPKTAKTITTRSTSLQANAKIRNEQSSKECRDVRYKSAFKAATLELSELKKKGLIPNYASIIAKYNKQFNLDGDGKQLSREKKMLNKSTLKRAMSKGIIGESPKKKGKPAKIDRDYLRLVALHANMEQIGTRGEVGPVELKATMMAGVMNTVHEGTFSAQYAWDMVRKENADILVPKGMMGSEDIRWQWVTYENLNLWFTGYKDELLRYGFAINEEEVLPDGTVGEITMVEQLKARNICFDETEVECGVTLDASGPRSKTYGNPGLNRAGSRITRNSRHTTAGLAVNMAGELLPPLLIYDTKAKNTGNYAIKDEWVDDLGYTRGKYGHKEFIQRLPFIAVRSSGGMDTDLFMEYIEEVTFDLYPKETCSLEIEFDQFGRLVKGPVLWNVDSGPGRLAAVTEDNQQAYDVWLERLHNQGVLIHGLCPNTTSVSAVMDELFRAYKISQRANTKKVFALKIRKSADAITAKKAALAAKHGGAENVPASEMPKVGSIVTLNAGDVGKIMYGDLTADGFPSPTSPIATSFTPEKIANAFAKLGMNPFTRKLLENPKVRHEVGQEGSPEGVHGDEGEVPCQRIRCECV